MVVQSKVGAFLKWVTQHRYWVAVPWRVGEIVREFLSAWREWCSLRVKCLCSCEFFRGVQRCWWQLNGDDIASIAARVAVAGRQTTATLSTFGRWFHTNLAAVTDAQLRTLLAAHANFGIVQIGGGVSFLLSLERYVTARVASMDRTTLAMCVDLLRQQRWLSTRILDAVARECVAYLLTCL